MSATVKATSDVDVPASAAARGAERVIAKALADNAFVALWIFVSALVILFNKYILTVYGFPFPVTLTMTHMFFCSSLAFVLVRVVKVVPASDPKSVSARLAKIEKGKGPSAQNPLLGLGQSEKSGSSSVCRRKGGG